MDVFKNKQLNNHSHLEQKENKPKKKLFQNTRIGKHEPIDHCFYNNNKKNTQLSACLHWAMSTKRSIKFMGITRIGVRICQSFSATKSSVTSLPGRSPNATSRPDRQTNQIIIHGHTEKSRQGRSSRHEMDTLMTFPRKSWLVLSIKTGGITLIDFNPEGTLVLEKQTPNLSAGYLVWRQLIAWGCLGG